MRVLVLGMVGLLVAGTAFADCLFGPDTRIQVKIDAISAPVFDAKGNRQDGCLLSARGKVLGYATEDRLCHATPGETVEVTLIPIGCCDTGRGSGDFTCAIRAGSGATTVYGNGMGVRSVGS